MKSSQDDRCAAGETWRLRWECVTGCDVLQQSDGAMTWEIAGLCDPLDLLQQTPPGLLLPPVSRHSSPFLSYSRLAACERHCSNVIGALFSVCDGIAPAGSVGWLDF